MGDSEFSLKETCSNVWDSCISLYQNYCEPEETAQGEELKNGTSEDTYTKRLAAEELRQLERRQVKGEQQPEAKPETKAQEAGKPETHDKPVQKTSFTSLDAKGDDFLKAQYEKLDQDLPKMAAEAKDMALETMGLPKGSQLPAGTSLFLTVSGGRGSPKTVSVQAIKIEGNFRYRINNGIPRYLTCSDLSLAAQRVNTVGFPAYVDLSEITNHKSQIEIKIKPDGTYELVKPNPDRDKGSPNNDNV